VRPPRRRARYRVKRVAFRRLCRSSANSINRSMSVTALAATGLAQIQPARKRVPGEPRGRRCTWPVPGDGPL